MGLLQNMVNSVTEQFSQNRAEPPADDTKRPGAVARFFMGSEKREKLDAQEALEDYKAQLKSSGAALREGRQQLNTLTGMSDSILKEEGPKTDAVARTEVLRQNPSVKDIDKASVKLGAFRGHSSFEEAKKDAQGRIAEAQQQIIMYTKLRTAARFDMADPKAVEITDTPMSGQSSISTPISEKAADIEEQGNRILRETNEAFDGGGIIMAREKAQELAANHPEIAKEIAQLEMSEEEPLRDEHDFQKADFSDTLGDMEGKSADYLKTIRSGLSADRDSIGDANHRIERLKQEITNIRETLGNDFGLPEHRLEAAYLTGTPGQEPDQQESKATPSM